MGYRNNPLMEPEFFTPPGSKRLYKGGGGGQVYYANQDKLAGVQADIATNLYNQYAAYAPQALGNLAGMVTDAQNGQYTQDLRNRAGTDAAAAAGMERSAVERQMASMGVNPNDPRFSGALRATALGNAANLAAAKNKAGQYGDDMAWARSQDFYNSLAGMPSQSASMLASSGAQYGQLGGAMQQQSNANMAGYGQFGAQIAGGMFKADGGYIDGPGFAEGGNVAKGYDDYVAAQPQAPVQRAAPQVQPTQPAPQMGLQAPAQGRAPGLYYNAAGDVRYFSNPEFNYPAGKASILVRARAPIERAQFERTWSPVQTYAADGGYIDEPGYALGGAVGGVSMPKLGNWRDRPSGFKMDEMSTGDKVMAVAAPIAMQAGANALGKHVINPLMDKAGAAIGDAVGGLFGGPAAASGANALWGAETAGIGSGLSSAGTSMAGQTIGSAIGDVGLTTALGAEAAGAGGATLASAGAGSAAGTAATGGLLSGAAAAAPWVGGAYLLGSALDLWADGGPVPHEQPRGLRLDMRQGGATPDIGTETSDSIPAWLSKGEYVVNADAVK
ncbi:MAG: hypothetical protein J5J04_00045, partial [Anaerolineae bacterium]|nr:hypothetical protein [Anaerolineae bacterium]